MDELAGIHAIEDYLAVAMAQNPEIQAARKRVEALENRVPQASSLEDPTLGVTFFPEQVETAAGQQQLLITASQRFPWLGKLQLRGDRAEAEADIARADLVATELDVGEQVRLSYCYLYYLQRALHITEENRIRLFTAGGAHKSDAVRPLATSPRAMT